MTTATPDTRAALEVTVPDIGDFADIPVIEVHVAEGDHVGADDPLVTLESDKATMDIPAPYAGTVTHVHLALNDRVSAGSPLLTLLPDGDGDGDSDGGGAGAQPADPAGPAVDTAAQAADVDQQEPAPEATSQVAASAQATAAAAAPANGTPAGRAAAQAVEAGGAPGESSGLPHAGPGVRRLARELDIDLAGIRGSGPKGRVVKEDLLAVLAPQPRQPAADATPAGGGIPEIPAQDFSVFGPVETRPLPRITKMSGPFLHRSWLNIPHVTHNDEADITGLEAYRKELDDAAKAHGTRVTLLSFLMKAAVSALREYPQCNTSLTSDKASLVYKSYYHIGVAVDTPQGLVVPVVRDVDRKGINELSSELGEVSARARDGKLSAADMQGGTFTISSLGGIGGTSFTPIVNAPEVAILGVVRAKIAPVWDGTEFAPRLMLPLSLSYDHRVIDGALAARFTRRLCFLLEDVRRLVL